MLVCVVSLLFANFTDVFQPIGVLFWQVFGEGKQLVEHWHAFCHHMLVSKPCGQDGLWTTAVHMQAAYFAKCRGLPKDRNLLLWNRNLTGNLIDAYIVFILFFSLCFALCCPASWLQEL